MRFLSDNTAGVCPEILAAIEEANRGLAVPYGEDPWTERLDSVFTRCFAKPVRVIPVVTGTAANSLTLATLAPRFSCVIAHEEAHVVRDEYGAPEFFSGGMRVVTASGPHAKITHDSLLAALDACPPSMQASVLSLTQATEYGTVYSPAELAAVCELAHSRGLKVHMDGARFANAVAYLGCEPADITWRAGVDVLCFGATKNGALAAEAAIFFDLQLVADAEVRRRRGGHLLSKSRYLSAQLIAYIESGVWRTNAVRANELARRIGAAAGERLLHPVQANEIFLRLDEPARQALRRAGFEFYDWDRPGSAEARFVTSWDQPEEWVVKLVHALSQLCD